MSGGNQSSVPSRNLPPPATSENPPSATSINLPPSYDEAMHNAVKQKGAKTPLCPSQTNPIRPTFPAYSHSGSVFPAPYQPPIHRHPYQYHTLGPQTVAVPVVAGAYGTVLDSQVPVQIKCPNCRKTVYTNVQSQYSATAYLTAMCLCFCGLPMCCFIPFCIPDCMDYHHVCPNCNQIIDIYKPYSM